MLDKSLFVIILFFSYSGGKTGKWCFEYTDDGRDRKNSIWCKKGCCGDSYDQYCCLDSENGMMIMGIVIGGIVLVAIIFSSILVAVFCCCRKTRGQTGQVCQPPATDVAMPSVRYGMVGYNGAINSTVVTPNMAPGSFHTWPQPPPSYDQLYKV